MRAIIAITASTAQEAKEKAIEPFKSFYGEQPFKIVYESARGDVTTMSGQILGWVCEFEAEAE